MEQFRPPSIPLITVDPYFSVWSFTDHLYDDVPRHWTGVPHGMSGLIWIDGNVYTFMGKVDPTGTLDIMEPMHMTQQSLKVQPLSSIYVFEAAGLQLEVIFTTPLLPFDVRLLSRPASYITFRVRSIDKNQHEARLYFDVTAEWCVDSVDSLVSLKHIEGESFEAGRIGQDLQMYLNRSGDDVRIDWGYFYLAVEKFKKNRIFLGTASIRQQFVKNGHICSKVSPISSKRVKDIFPLMGTIVEFPSVGNSWFTDFLVLAYDDVYSIQYFGTNLPSLWREFELGVENLLSSALGQYETVMEKCQIFNEELAEMGQQAGGVAYAEILSLAYRQAMAAHKLVRSPQGKLLFFSKECFSNGCIGTVDVSYPSAPLFLLYNPELVKAMLRPILDYAESGMWPYDFAPHDVGQYPLANGQVYGEKKLEFQMPIEECGNLLILTAAVVVAEHNPKFANEYWGTLTQWANYLESSGFDPREQLCTDDFAGPQAHNANLSIKAILGIASYGLMCDWLGHKEDADRYRELTIQLGIRWVEACDCGDHYALSLYDRNSWSMKYNLVWDSILGTHVFPDSVRDKEVSWYVKQLRRYGIPLDNRHVYTKADWLMWVASLASDETVFQKLSNPLWRFLNETESRVPFSDWYDTETGRQVTWWDAEKKKNFGFQHRSVIGGVFIKALMMVWARNRISAFPERG